MGNYVTITGHRNIPGKEAGRIGKAFEQILKTELGEGYIFCSQIADGADQILAKTALEHNQKLLAVIPMGIQEFCSMDLKNRKAFDEIINIPNTQVKEIKIQCNENPVDRRIRDLYYRRANEYMLAMSEKVIAVWDGKKSKSDAGTKAVIRKAIKEGKPVYWIPLEKGIEFDYMDLNETKRIEKNGYCLLI